MKSSNRVSIKEIAKLSGVSTATVSRVLNDNGRFSEETRRKVLDNIEKFNYRTNIVAKSLRTNKSQSLGIIVPDITNEFFARIVLAIENYCFKLGYSVSVYNTNEDENKENLCIRDLEAKGVDGLIYFIGRSDVLLNMTQRNFPVVCIDRNTTKTQGTITVESDNYNGGFIATEELIKKGCKKIVVLRDYRDISATLKRSKGYIDALTKYGILFSPELMLCIEVSAEAASKAISELIDKGIEFDGIFAQTDWMAAGALEALKRNNIKVPDKVKLVGFDNISISQYSSPKITTVNQDKTLLGETAARIIMDMIENKTIEQKNVVISTNLITRETT